MQTGRSVQSELHGLSGSHQCGGVSLLQGSAADGSKY